MGRMFQIILFLSIASAIFFGLHFFVYKSLVHALFQTAGVKRVLKWCMWISGLSFYLAMFLSRKYDIHFLDHYAYTWLGVLAISFSVMVFYRLLALVFDQQAKGIAIGTVVVIVLISLYSYFNANRTPLVKEVTIPINHLPAELSGFKIVQLSDLHLDAYKSPRGITRIVDLANSLSADLIVITGDLVDRGATEVPEFQEQLKRLHAKHGVFAVTGNHEIYAGINRFLEFMKDTGIKVLRNESVTIAGELQLAGINDEEEHQFDQGPDLKKALAQCDREKPIVLLYHRPLLFDQAILKGVDLQLSGHTHGGQIPPMDLLVYLLYRFPVGLYERKGAYIYTSPGTGHWGPAMRLLTSPEITLFTLKPKVSQ